LSKILSKILSTNIGDFLMKENKIKICVHDINTNVEIEKVFKNVPDLFNIYDICNYLCTENPSNNCEDCIVKMLIMDKYVSKKEYGDFL